ncbi:hypothetical protein L6452_05895 [Arctium lappa]|uniref:Uncharacterized protein n=1 Tax=Arctium lappa TaxID=4217 RepID=A0ACB9EHY5_ARCLA|nr:hypothetical protein L6452_05895 [Arctium lappa]
MDVAANTTVITDLTNQIGSVRAKIDSQDKVLQAILHHLKNSPTPAPSFTKTNRKYLKMVTEFGVLATTAFSKLEDKVKKQAALQKKKTVAKKSKKDKKVEDMAKTSLVADTDATLNEDKEGEKNKENAIIEGEQNIIPSIIDEGDEYDNSTFIV